MLVIVAHMRLPFFEIFSNFVQFHPNFQIFACPFSKYFQILYIFAQIFKYFALFCPFSEKSHACLYVLHHKEHKNRCDLLFSIYIYCKNIINFLFWVLWTYLVTSIKKITPTCRNSDAYLHAKMNSIPNF